MANKKPDDFGAIDINSLHPDWIRKEKDEYFIDENGVLIKKELAEEPNLDNENRHERLGGIYLPDPPQKHRKTFAQIGGKRSIITPTQKKKSKPIRNTTQINKNRPPKKRSKQINPDMDVICPVCGKTYIYSELYNHVLAFHENKNPKIILARLNREIRGEAEDRGSASENEKFKQSVDEERDGGKYLGFMRRESGKFGSLPLHDNYEDESNSK